MSDTTPDFFRGKVSKGKPISSNGLADGINATHNAITKMTVRGDGRFIDAKIDWANGEPRITIRWIGPT
jgi:hypothetical protein